MNATEMKPPTKREARELRRRMVARQREIGKRLRGEHGTVDMLRKALLGRVVVKKNGSALSRPEVVAEVLEARKRINAIHKELSEVENAIRWLDERYES